MKFDAAIKTLKMGGIGILPTDTLYGIVGRANLPETVDRIYELKDRNLSKPFIILISSIKDLEQFEIHLSQKEIDSLIKYWPGKVSVVLKVTNIGLEYLTRGLGSLAFRLPDKKDLCDLIKETGPLVAPSANPEGEVPATTIEEAKKYFTDKVEFYIDQGKLEGEPSTLITLESGNINILREGAVKII